MTHMLPSYLGDVMQERSRTSKMVTHETHLENDTYVCKPQIDQMEVDKMHC